jgi:large subunit ribosomal protein L5
MNYNTKLLHKNFIDLYKNNNKEKNPHSVPKLTKIVASVNFGNSGSDKKIVDSAMKDFLSIFGSKPVFFKSKVSDAAFKIREGQIVGLKITLRSDKMFLFLDKMIYVALPRIRDFRGIKKSFDVFGNLSISLPGNSSLFLESNLLQDLNLSFSISQSSPDLSLNLLSSINIPFLK